MILLQEVIRIQKYMNLMFQRKFLIKAVEEFKTDNPKYVLSNQERFIDGKRDKKDHWYHIWFYYPDRNKVVNPG